MGSYVHACQTEMGSYVQPFSKVDGTICPYLSKWYGIYVYGLFYLAPALFVTMFSDVYCVLFKSNIVQPQETVEYLLVSI